MKKKTIVSIIIILLLVLTTGCNKYNSDTVDDNTPVNTTPQRELTESEKMISRISALIDTGYAYDAGDYIKGDIPAGEYLFVRFEGSGSYYCEKDEAGNIIDNENFDSFGYVKVHAAGNLETSGVLIDLSVLETLDVKSGKEVYEILNDKKDYNQGGYYKVGLDLEPGKYVLESFGSGYWAIMSGPVSGGDIVDNDNFNGRASVTLKKGQYLSVSRATITKQ